MSTIISIDSRQNQQDSIGHMVSKESTALNASSAIKAALVFAGTIGTYYLAKTTGVFSYFGWRPEQKQSLGGRKLMEVKNAEGSLSIRTNIEKVGQESSLSTTQHTKTYQKNPFVEFEEEPIEKLNVLPERRSISIQNPIQDQNATVGRPFELIIDGNSVFDFAGSISLSIESMPIWLNSYCNPEFISSYDMIDDAFDVTISGNYAYVANENLGLQIIDITNLSNPTFVGSYDTPSLAKGVSVFENYAYVVDEDSGLQIIDVSNPSNPTLKGSYDTPGRAQDVALVENYAFVADFAAGLQIIDITNSSNPIFVGSCDTLGYFYEVVISGNYAYVANGGLGLQIINVTDPSNPTSMGSYDTPDLSKDIAVSGNYSYLTDGYPGLQIIDVTDPCNPIFEGSYTTSNWMNGVVLSGDYAFVADVTAGLQIIDISNPSNPILQCVYDMSGFALNVVISGNYAFVLDLAPSLQIIDTNLDKLILSGIPIFTGIYSVDVHACNESGECITESFDIIVSYNLTLLLAIGSTTFVICSAGLCLSVVCVIAMSKKHCNMLRDENVIRQREFVEIEEQQQFESTAPSKDLQFIDDDYDVTSNGQKMPMAPDYEGDVILTNSNVANATEVPNDKYDEEPPEDLCCPISTELMKDPVMVVESGQTYCEKAIKTWFVDHDTDPLTGGKVISKRLVVNYAIKRLVDEWVEQHKTTK